MTTAVQVQYRRGTASQVAAFSGAQGEMVVDTTNNRVVVQDGATAGGWPAAKLTEIAGGNLNKFRNGTMDVWQRGTSSLTATTSGSYTADGWIVLPTGAGVTAAQAGGRLLTKNSLQVTGATSVTDLIIKQRIESLIAAAFCSQTVTVQAQVYNNTGGAITPKLTVNRPSAQDNYASVTADVNAVSLQSCTSGAWTLVSYTFAANSASYNGLEIVFDFGNNFSANTKSVQITECDIRVTPGVATGLNSSPPLPELRPISSELASCQRYFNTLSSNSSAPYAQFGSGTASTTSNVYAALFFATMRVAPSISSSATSTFSLVPNTVAVTAIAFAQITPSSAQADRGPLAALDRENAQWRRRVLRRALAVLVAASLVLIAALCSRSHARDDGRFANSPLKAWFDQLASGKGLCCSFADGVRIAVDEWDNLGSTADGGSGYRVRLNGQWLDVPQAALITEPNRAGQAYVWPYQDAGKTKIRCFIPGAGT
jgi:Major tropism determinant N-terminal domain